jgi:hypothetical protein
MKLHYYILDAEHRPVKAASMMQWAQWFEDFNNRIVDYTEITSAVYVSTVFVGLDHRFGGGGPPIVFETCIFGGPLDGNEWRYASWDDAEAGHKAAVRKARAAINQKAAP